jgi:hypothetical protein
MPPFGYNNGSISKEWDSDLGNNAHRSNRASATSVALSLAAEDIPHLPCTADTALAEKTDRWQESGAEEVGSQLSPVG